MHAMLRECSYSLCATLHCSYLHTHACCAHTRCMHEQYACVYKHTHTYTCPLLGSSLESVVIECCPLRVEVFMAPKIQKRPAAVLKPTPRESCHRQLSAVLKRPAAATDVTEPPRKRMRQSQRSTFDRDGESVELQVPPRDRSGRKDKTGMAPNKKWLCKAGCLNKHGERKSAQCGCHGYCRDCCKKKFQ